MHFINRRFIYLLTLPLYSPQPPVSCKACNMSYAVVVQCNLCCTYCRITTIRWRFVIVVWWVCETSRVINSVWETTSRTTWINSSTGVWQGFVLTPLSTCGRETSTLYSTLYIVSIVPGFQQTQGHSSTMKYVKHSDNTAATTVAATVAAIGFCDDCDVYSIHAKYYSSLTFFLLHKPYEMRSAITVASLHGNITMQKSSKWCLCVWQ